MAKEYCDKTGDHVVRFCHKHGFHDWKTIWDDNSSLKGKRSNPLMLFTGDKYHQSDLVSIPKKDQATEKQSMDTDEAYKIPRQKLCLRLRVLKGDLQPLADIPFKLAISGGETYEGKTDASGKVVVSEDDGGPDPEINKNSKTATLEVTVSQEKAETENEEAGDDALKADHKLKWNLQIGRLDPVKEDAPDTDCISGVQQRLNNLGFFTGPVDGILGQNTNYAIQSFQSKFDLTIDGDPGQAALQDKLQSVHDTDAAVTRPTGTEPVTATIDKDKFLKTKDKDVGHVAPQFVGGSPNAINTIVVAPEYRLTLELGDINDLFLEPDSSWKGKAERLQVAGLYYFPLNHAKTEDETAIKFAWQYYKDKFTGTEAKLKEKIKNFVVDGNKLPPMAEDETKPKDENFVKIRVPGGYTYIKNKGKFKPTHDANYPAPFGGYGPSEVAEQFVKDNIALGSIPIKALIEERYGSTGPWQVAKDKWVYYQLVKPYDLPAFKPSVDPQAQINRPPLRESNMQDGTASGVGPKKHVDAAMPHNIDAKDPQVDNCYKDRGGKRGLKAAGNVLELKVNLASFKDQKAGTNNEKDKRPGFHCAHTHSQRKDVVKEPFIEKPEEAPAQGEKHEHALRVKSNKDGWTGIIFRPSHTAGDRYRFRIYVGPDTLESDGQDPLAVAVETGTMVVWRNLRVSRIMRLPYASMSATIKDQFVQEETDKGKASSLIATDPLVYYKKMKGFRKLNGTSDVGYHDVDLSAKSDSSAAYEGFRKVMAYAFCEVELDPGATTVETVQDADYEAALAAAVTHAKTNNTYDWDLDQLIITDKTKVTASNAFGLIPMRLPRQYNKLAPTKKVKLNIAKTALKKKKAVDSWFDSNILYPFVYHLTDKGFRPGLTMLQAPTISPWHAYKYLNDYSIGLGWKVCVMREGKDIYPYSQRQKPESAPDRYFRDGSIGGFKYYQKYFGYAALTVHEWGHNLFRIHAPPKPAPENTTEHDDKADGYCVMTYRADEGHFCGKCTLALAGWTNFASLP